MGGHHWGGGETATTEEKARLLLGAGVTEEEARLVLGEVWGSGVTNKEVRLLPGAGISEEEEMRLLSVMRMGVTEEVKLLPVMRRHQGGWGKTAASTRDGIIEEEVRIWSVQFKPQPVAILPQVWSQVRLRDNLYPIPFFPSIEHHYHLCLNQLLP